MVGGDADDPHIEPDIDVDHGRQILRRDLQRTVGQDRAHIAVCQRCREPALFPSLAASTVQSGAEVLQPAGDRGVDHRGQQRGAGLALPTAHEVAKLARIEGFALGLLSE